jgi:hypothetical protein
MEHQSRTARSRGLKPAPTPRRSMVEKRASDPIGRQLVQVLSLVGTYEAAALVTGEVNPKPMKAVSMSTSRR